MTDSRVCSNQNIRNSPKETRLLVPRVPPRQLCVTSVTSPHSVSSSAPPQTGITATSLPSSVDERAVGEPTLLSPLVLRCAKSLCIFFLFKEVEPYGASCRRLPVISALGKQRQGDPKAC